MYKKIARFFVFTVLMFALAFALPVFAQGENPPVAEPLSIEFFLKALFGLILAVPGATALGVVLVNIGKAVGLVKDGAAPQASSILSVLFAVTIWILTLAVPNFEIAALDAKLGDFSGIMITLTPVIIMVWKYLAPKFHDAIKNVGWMGYSFSLQE